MYKIKTVLLLAIFLGCTIVSLSNEAIHGHWAYIDQGMYGEVWFEENRLYEIYLNEYDQYSNDYVLNISIEKDKIILKDEDRTFKYKLNPDGTMSLSMEGRTVTMRRFDEHKFDLFKEFGIKNLKEMEPKVEDESDKVEMIYDKLIWNLEFRAKLFRLYYGEEGYTYEALVLDFLDYYIELEQDTPYYKQVKAVAEKITKAVRSEFKPE